MQSLAMRAVHISGKIYVSLIRCLIKLTNFPLRTTAFSSIYAGFLISDMISTPLGAAFIATNPWIPLLAAVGIRLTFTLVVIGVTIRYRNVERFKDPSMLNGHSSTTLLSPQISLRDRARRVIADLAETAVWMTKDVILLIVAFFFIQISRESTDLLLQYSSLKVHWDYAKVSGKSLHALDRLRH